VNFFADESSFSERNVGEHERFVCVFFFLVFLCPIMASEEADSLSRRGNKAGAQIREYANKFLSTVHGAVAIPCILMEQ
jgi:hypothetical protein